MRYVDMVKSDIYVYLRNNYGTDIAKYREALKDEDAIYDTLWVDDSITGNASGSFTCSREEARRYVLGDIETVVEAAYDFGCIEEFTDKLFKKDYEWLDVLARCYVLSEAVNDVIKEIME